MIFQQKITHTFPNKACLKLTRTVNDFFLVDIEQGDQTHRIPLLLTEFDCQIALENLRAIKWMDVPFSTFCAIIAGFFYMVLKYKSPVVQALATRSPLSATPQIP
jgi:hypothetical protein